MSKSVLLAGLFSLEAILFYSYNTQKGGDNLKDGDECKKDEDCQSNRCVDNICVSKATEHALYNPDIARSIGPFLTKEDIANVKIASKKSFPNVERGNPEYLLMQGLKTGNLSDVKLAVKKGASLTKELPGSLGYEMTPAKQAAKSGNLEILEWIAEQGVRMNSSIASEAARSGNLEMVKWIAERVLNLGDNYVKDVSNLNLPQNLKELHLGDNYIGADNDQILLITLPRNLDVLDLGNNYIRDLSHVQMPNSLRRIVLGENYFTNNDIQALRQNYPDVEIIR